MATTIAQKLKIREGDVIRTVHPPTGYKAGLEPLPEGVRFITSGTPYHQLHWFVTNRAQLEEEVASVVSLIGEGVTCWIFYPKGSSGIQTDLTRDKGWESLLAYQELHWVSLISFNETWSAFAMRKQTAADKKKSKVTKERAIFDYIDPAGKLLFLPEDLAAALKKSKKEESFFQSLSFTNRKEYVEWIVSARRDETRKVRVKESLERLKKGWKNPMNR
jgi:bacteriocin resistance YdeI/OmpD-like protein